MSKVHVYTEWDPLEEIIVGRADNAQIPRCDKGLHAIEYADLPSPKDAKTGPYPAKCIEETNEDLEILCNTLQKMGITVRRPDPFDHSREYATPDWKSDGNFNYCPRDIFVCAGETIIESPMPLRGRQFEPLSYRPILIDYLKSGSRWIAAPRPRLLDETYVAPNEKKSPNESALRNLEPIFDAANVLRIGRDLLYLVSDTGNRLGAQWLQLAMGPEYRVHPVEGLYSGSHIDTTLTLVRPGLVVASAERVSPKNLPALFKKWDVIYLDEVNEEGQNPEVCTSKWIGMNFMMVNPSLALVDKHQTALIRELEKRKVDVLGLELRHSRTMAGSFHCVTIDVRRKGKLESYCD
jgi:N-dimethylarginine dimethylaminohydrolase